MDGIRRAGIAALAALFVFSGFPVTERSVSAAEAAPVVSSDDGCCSSEMASCCCSASENCGSCSGHTAKKAEATSSETIGPRLAACPGPASKKLALITGLREIVPPGAGLFDNLPVQYAPRKATHASPESPSFSPDTPPPRKVSA